MDTDTTHVDPRAEVHPSSTLGSGTKVWQFATICMGAKIGDQCAIGSSVYIGHYARLGDRVRIQDKAHITARSIIGDDVYIGAGVLTADDKHPRVNNPQYKHDPPVIESDVSIGNGANILPGVRLGRGCTVGAGAVVTRDVAPYTTVFGNPARPMVKKKHVDDNLYELDIVVEQDFHTWPA